MASRSVFVVSSDAGFSVGNFLFTEPFQPWGEEWEVSTDVICGVSKVPILPLLLIRLPAKIP